MGRRKLRYRLPEVNRFFSFIRTLVNGKFPLDENAYVNELSWLPPKGQANDAKLKIIKVKNDKG